MGWCTRRLQLLPMFLKDAIDKLGVDVNVFRAGTYRALRTISRSDMGASERERARCGSRRCGTPISRTHAARSLPPAHWRIRRR